MIFRTLLSFVLAFAGSTAAMAQDVPSFDELERRADAIPRLSSVVILHNGNTVFERGLVDRPTNIKSASKTIISALVGIAIDKGVLEGPDQKIAPILEASLPEDPDPRLKDITLDHLMTMRSGLEGTSGPNYGRWISSRNWVQHVLSRPFADEPGGRMLYSTGSTHLLSAVLTKASGKPTLTLANEWLAQPLGFRIVSWDRDRQGIYLGGNNMAISPRALSRFGELYRNGGMVGDVRVLPSEWVAASWKPVTESVFTGHGYGYGWFSTELAGHAVNYAWGHGGQMLYIIPDAGLTIAMTSNTEGYKPGSDHVGKLHALVAETIIPVVMATEQTANESAAR